MDWWDGEKIDGWWNGGRRVDDGRRMGVGKLAGSEK